MFRVTKLKVLLTNKETNHEIIFTRIQCEQRAVAGGDSIAGDAGGAG